MLLAGCTLGDELGMLNRDPGDVRGASLDAHAGLGGTGPGGLLSIDVGTRVDIARGDSRWAFGTSLQAGRPVGPLAPYGRLGLWHAVFSDAPEDSYVPSVELGAFVPIRHKVGDRPEYGEATEGFVAGLREDFDTHDYFTVFVGYAVFIMPGY